MPDIELILFIAFVIFFVAYYILWKKSDKFSKTMRNFSLKQFVDEILEDYGEIGVTELKIPFVGGRQNLRLLKCKKDGEVFFILETTQSGIGYIQSYWTKLDHKMAEKLWNIAQENKF